jgi:hypothetical protein
VVADPFFHALAYFAKTGLGAVQVLKQIEKVTVIKHHCAHAGFLLARTAVDQGLNLCFDFATC